MADMVDPDELRALREAAAFIDSQDFDVLCATGKDRASFLHRITSGKVAGLEPGQGSRSLLLDVRGHVLASLLIFVRARSIRLLAASGQGAEVAAGLAKFAVMDDFAVGREPELATLVLLGPQAAAALAAVGMTVPSALQSAPLLAHAELATQSYGTLWLARGRRLGADGFLVVAPRPACDALAAALLAAGTRRLPPTLAEVARIAALEPAAGKEITPERFPVEIGLGAAIDHGKGCYVGQETIVRMRDRGNVRKRLVLLRLAGSESPTAGDKIVAEGQPAAGLVTSGVGQSPQPPLALALLASGVPVGATVRIQGAGVELTAEVAAESPPWG